MDNTLKIIIDTLSDSKGIDICYVDMETYNPLVKYFIIVSGNSIRHTHALAMNVRQELAKNNLPLKNIEGNHNSEWVLVDAIDYVVQIFTEDARVKYGLEKMYLASNLQIIKVN